MTLPVSDPRHKRVENRGWGTSYRGLLLIHAGKSREWLELDPTGTFDEAYDIPVCDMAFGAAVAVARLVGVVELLARSDGKRTIVPRWAGREWPWLAGHAHTEGPVCWVLEDVRPLPKPIPMAGKQGLWEAPI
jgi:hypothetical protein